MNGMAMRSTVQRLGRFPKPPGFTETAMPPLKTGTDAHMAKRQRNGLRPALGYIHEKKISPTDWLQVGGGRNGPPQFAFVSLPADR